MHPSFVIPITVLFIGLMLAAYRYYRKEPLDPLSFTILFAGTFATLACSFVWFVTFIVGNVQ